ncbi:DUF2812 domain-containing protein [Oceanobacillus manasiensis]|uniref:DUF2812 domain-containing protein n=1 Tax=Oceanobacillus manasiensis TaxID=586413 RepID=UPI0005A8ADA5|nr:DUF2812 domain-containing protein [Oceanobacillus manasiensis]
MKIRLFKPFWSYDLPKTEGWLEEMAQDGFKLLSINLFFRTFTFEKSDPTTATYHINYDPSPNPLPNALTEDGWKTTLQKRNWSILCKFAQRNEVQTWPVRTAIHSRNNKLQYLFGGLGLLLSFATFVHVLLFLLVASTNTVTIPGLIGGLSPFLFLIYLSTWIFSLYSYFKLQKSNDRILTELAPVSSTSYPLPVEGQYVVKWKFGWMYAPDKLEKWLEKMAAAGYHLKKVSPRGIKFYFIMGKPRLIKYQIDYRGTGKTGYMSIHRDAGWEDMFTSTIMFSEWTIWRQTYSKNEDPPIMHSDQEGAKKQARKVAIMNTCIFSPVLLLNILVTYQRLSWQQIPSTTLEVTNFFLQLVLITLFGSFFVRSWAYYVRVRKKFPN